MVLEKTSNYGNVYQGISKQCSFQTNTLLTSYSLMLPFQVQPSLIQMAERFSTSLRAALSGKAWKKKSNIVTSCQLQSRRKWILLTDASFMFKRCISVHTLYIAWTHWLQRCIIQQSTKRQSFGASLLVCQHTENK